MEGECPGAMPVEQDEGRCRGRLLLPETSSASGFGAYTDARGMAGVGGNVALGVALYGPGPGVENQPGPQLWGTMNTVSIVNRKKVLPPICV